jgi:hypothetical protein
MPDREGRVTRVPEAPHTMARADRRTEAPVVLATQGPAAPHIPVPAALRTAASAGSAIRVPAVPPMTVRAAPRTVAPAERVTPALGDLVIRVLGAQVTTARVFVRAKVCSRFCGGQRLICFGIPVTKVWSLELEKM